MNGKSNESTCLSHFLNTMSMRLTCIALITATFFHVGCHPNTSTETSIHLQLPKKVDFNFHIKPILSDRCFKCHGPDEKVREANLRFDVKEVAFAPLDSTENRYAIVPGNLKKSQLVYRISHSDPEERMPPPESNLSLSDHEIALLKKWIQQGAEWKPHWSFIPPGKPSLPDVHKTSWPVNEIDYYTLSKMETQGLSPSKEADKIHLVRRLSFDLTGLPPTLDEVESFLADDSQNAYENLVDHYLSSPSYGERMALPWLDLARYADTHGYQDDDIRSQWPWRDWVIKAFNENMSFDQFVTWQMAGDLLPEPTYEQKLATGFNRNHMINGEGGAIPEEYRVEYVADRAQTAATAFLGLTMQCARCHDHKYDPISQKEFYQMFSFFNSVPEKGLDGVNYTPEPSLEIPESKVAEIKYYLLEKINKQKRILEKQKSEKRADFQTWEQNQSTEGIYATSSPIPQGLIAHYNLDYIQGEKVTNRSDPAKPGRVVNDVVEAKGKFSGGLGFNGKNYVDLGNIGDFDRHDAFSFACWIKIKKYIDNDGPIFSKVEILDPSTPLKAGSAPSKGYEIRIGGHLVGLNMNSGLSEREISAFTLDPFPWDEWFHLTVTYDGSARSSGVRIYFNGKSQQLTDYVNKPLGGSIKTTSPLYLASPPKTGVKGVSETKLDEVLIFKRALSADEVSLVMARDPLASIAGKSDLQSGQRESLYRHYLHNFDEKFQAFTDEISKLKRKEYELDIQLRPTMIMQDMDTVRPAYILNRGQYDVREERVHPGTPGRIMPFPSNLPGNRLGLAKWLLDPKNPLTSRVTVNRLWQMLFGEGIVSTVDDFGNQGALPTHPKLLDWLAVEFVESGWDIKHLLRLMVNSATYRQSSKVTLESQQKDPQNRWLARAPQYRMSAETIRDNLLATSGLLVDKIGGPSVKPYQPPGLWLEITSGRGTARYEIGRGEELYRKSLYTFWKRTIPPPSMITFDAATRNYCVVKRQTTSTPLQALVLLNDPQVIEASRALAERMIKEGGDTQESRIQFAFRIATSRYPEKTELDALKEVFEFEKAGYEKDIAAADALLSVGQRPLLEAEYDKSELAAYSVVANAIFNLDETITKY